MRVFHGPNNISGGAGVLAAAQRRMGVDATSVCFPTGSFRFAVDHELPYGMWSRLTLLSMARRFDVFHFYFGESLAGSHLTDVAVLRRLGKQVHFYFCGCDLRDSKQVIARHAISACAECWPMGCSANRDRAAKVAMESDGVFVSTPDLIEFAPGATLLPQPLDLTRFDLLAARSTGRPLDGPFRVAHAPSNRAIKGTKYVEAAVDELRRGGIDIELVIVEGMTYEQSLDTYLGCDIGIDQMLIGAYGQFAVEMMALGRPVVCFLRDDLVELYPERPPIVNASKYDLTEVLRELARDREALRVIGQRGVAYAQRVHAADRVAAIAVDAYEQVRSR